MSNQEAAGDPFLSPKHGATEVYLIRHADALPEAPEVVLDGAYDSQALSELGRRQAQALAERLRDAALSAIYSSPIGRAYHTAIPAAEALGLEVQIDDALREVALGPIGSNLPPGATAEQVAASLRERLREIAAVALSIGLWSSIPGSEPAHELRERVTSAVERIAAAHPEQRIAVVSHGGTINAYIAALLGIERDYFFPCANTSISMVRIKGERRLLLALNDVAHLRQAGMI